MLTQNEAMGAPTVSDGGGAPITSFWVRIMTSCISIKRGVGATLTTALSQPTKEPIRALSGSHWIF